MQQVSNDALLYDEGENQEGDEVEEKEEVVKEKEY